MMDKNRNMAGPGETGSEVGANRLASLEQAAFEAAVLRTLEQLPEIDIPASFPARVTRLAIAQPPAQPSVWAGFGPRIALGSSVLLLALLFLVAAHATPSFFNFRFDAELLLLVELGAVGLLVPHLASRE